MTDRVHYHPDLIFSVGTRVVTLVDVPGSADLVLHPRGTVGVVVKSPTDLEHSYRIRFSDGFEAPLKRSEPRWANERAPCSTRAPSGPNRLLYTSKDWRRSRVAVCTLAPWVPVSPES